MMRRDLPLKSLWGQWDDLLLKSLWGHWGDEIFHWNHCEGNEEMIFYWKHCEGIEETRSSIEIIVRAMRRWSSTEIIVRAMRRLDLLLKSLWGQWGDEIFTEIIVRAIRRWDLPLKSCSRSGQHWRVCRISKIMPRSSLCKKQYSNTLNLNESKIKKNMGLIIDLEFGWMWKVPVDPPIKLKKYCIWSYIPCNEMIKKLRIWFCRICCV